MKRKTGVFVLGLFVPLLALSVQAANEGIAPTPSQKQTQVRDGDIYGYQMMTTEERDAYRARMRAANTYEEREQIRREHHEQMAARAKERGITLPEQPPARGPRMGTGMGGPAGAAGSGRGPRN